MTPRPPGYPETNKWKSLKLHIGMFLTDLDELTRYMYQIGKNYRYNLYFDDLIDNYRDY